MDIHVFAYRTLMLCLCTALARVLPAMLGAIVPPYERTESEKEARILTSYPPPTTYELYLWMSKHRTSAQRDGYLCWLVRIQMETPFLLPALSQLAIEVAVSHYSGVGRLLPPVYTAHIRRTLRCRIAAASDSCYLQFATVR